MPNIYKIVDTHDTNYPLMDGVPFNKFDAGAELMYQVEKYFPGMFIFEEVSSRTGNGVPSKMTHICALVSGKAPLGYVWRRRTVRICWNSDVT